MRGDALALLALAALAAPINALLVVTTTPNLAHDVGLLACPGDTAKSIVPPGVDLHEYQLGPADLQLLREADLVVVMGGEALDERLVELHGEGIVGGALVVVNDIEGIEALVNPATGRPNVHGTLLHARNYLKFMEHLAETMSGLNPRCSDTYARRLEAVRNALAALPGDALQGRKAIVSSPVVQYAARWLGVVVVGVVRDEVGAPLTLRDLEELRSGAREADLMVASSLDGRLVEEARRLGVPTLVVSFPTSDKSTLDILRETAEAASRLDLGDGRVQGPATAGVPLAAIFVGALIAAVLGYLFWSSVRTYRN